ncbi:multiple sugar transport system permease protein [Arboricoccus pini]|uniref:Multiple sugar transport system permease protein n=1 Tax=Arboricoccus pini TaxID=1963835 RepID=A0A212RZ82_9PROT|nr:carbohydrate ABC transporter permease [Arboricoccus pini]SNB77940.1 multiple sugar transport system permease protein [Arboricoccus pini]
MRKSGPWLTLATLLLLIWSILPIYWMVRMAFLTPAEITQFPPPIFPTRFNIASFFNVLGFDHTLADGTMVRASGQANQVLRGLVNSVIVAVIVTVITLVIVVPLAYVFARLEFRFKNLLLNAVLLAVALPPVSTLIPFYAMFVQLKLAGTLTGLVLVDLTLTVPFVAWMLIGYFRNLPPVERLARIDGYSRFGTLFFLIVPMAKSGVAVAAVIAFLFAWNEFTFALILVNGTTANTLPTAISGFLFQNPQPSNLAACIVLTILPPGLVAYFLQRHVAEMSLVDPVR